MWQLRLCTDRMHKRNTKKNTCETYKTTILIITVVSLYCTARLFAYDATKKNSATREATPAPRNVHIQEATTTPQYFQIHSETPEATPTPRNIELRATCTILIYPREKIDNFWGGGHTDRLVAEANKCSSVCRFVSGITQDSRIDGVLFVAGVPGRVDMAIEPLWKKLRYRARTTAVLHTEKDDDLNRVLKDRSLFDARISYSFNADIFHGQVCGGLLEMRTEMMEERLPEPREKRRKRKGIVGFISNCGAQFRNKYIPKMMKHVHVDHFGACFRDKNQSNNKVLERSSSSWRSDKTNMMRHYKFGLSFENFEADEYITEKIWDVYLAGTIPIYYGSRAVYKYAPKDSFINVHSFNSEVDLVRHIHEIDMNETLFDSYFRFNIAQINATIAKYSCVSSWLCQFCDLVHQRELQGGQHYFVETRKTNPA